jgi:hypothetical protein
VTWGLAKKLISFMIGADIVFLANAEKSKNWYTQWSLKGAQA